MADIITMGELLCEIMRPDVDMPLEEPGLFRGPFPSGAPAIFADTVARLGHRVKLIGGVGRDAFGSCLLSRLQSDGVDTEAVLLSPTGSTGVAFVSYDRFGDRKFLFHFADTPATLACAPRDPSFYEGVKYFHIMGCSLAASATFGEEILTAMRLALESGARVSFDPNVRPELMTDPAAADRVARALAASSVIETGESELLSVTGASSTDEAVELCFRNPNLELLLIKKGARGCTAHTRETSFSFGIYETEVADPTGAGDCFDAALLCGLLEGYAPADAVKIASAAASLNTAAFGPMEGKISREAIRHMTGLAL